MPFNKPPEHIATSIGQIEYRFVDATGEANQMSASAVVSVLNEDAQHHWSIVVGNLVQHLTTDEKAQLVAMFNRLRNLAETELL